MCAFAEIQFSVATGRLETILIDCHPHEHGSFLLWCGKLLRTEVILTACFSSQKPRLSHHVCHGLSFTSKLLLKCKVLSYVNPSWGGCCSLGWPRTQYIVQARFKLMTILLPSPILILISYLRFLTCRVCVHFDNTSSPAPWVCHASPWLSYLPAY